MENLMKINSLFILFLTIFGIQGCAGFSTHTSHPRCPDTTSINSNSPEQLMDLWTCGKTEIAEKIALEGALNGNQDLALIYIEIRASKHDLNSGMIFAIRGAENGDIEMAKWVMRATQKYETKSLPPLINSWFYKHFKETDKHTYITLSEFLDYAISQAYKGDVSSSIHGLAFADAKVGLLIPQERQKILARVSKIEEAISAKADIDDILVKAKTLSSELQKHKVR